MIAICPNPFRDSELKYTRQAAEMLHAAGYETAVCPVFAEDAPQMIPEDIKATTLDAVRSRCSLVVVIGGDGTILSAARQLHNADIPILGVNLGSKGFMAALEPEHMQLIVKAAAGEYTVSRRMMLDIELERGGEMIYRDKALNDVVLHGYGDCIRLTAWCAGDRITSFSGDGIILSTPTGSPDTLCPQAARSSSRRLPP
ncbi:MAG: NAD(+)/NADH kinase [Oscillospiraceae bacterium]